MEAKAKTIALYRCQNGPGMAETEKAANSFFGSRIGVEYAEAFTRMFPLLPDGKSILNFTHESVK